MKILLFIYPPQYIINHNHNKTKLVRMFFPIQIIRKFRFRETVNIFQH